MGRLRHAILTDGLMDWAADRTIVYATAYNRPAIIVPWFDQVELVSTLGAVLRLPQIAGFRVYRQTLGAAVTITPDFRKCVATADKRIVAGHAAIIIQAHNDPLVISQILRRVRGQVPSGRSLAFPESQEQVAVVIEYHLATVVSEADRLRREDFHHIGQLIIFETSSDYRSDRSFPFFLGITQVNPAVIAEIWMW